MENRFKKISLSRIADVFTEEEIACIKKYYLPDYEPHQCHSNSARFAIDGFDGYYISFIEGSFGYNDTPMFGHCWNKVVRESDGKEFYIDITTELVNGLDPTEKQVWMYDEWDWTEIENLFDEYGKSFIPHNGFINDNGELVKIERQQ